MDKFDEEGEGKRWRLSGRCRDHKLLRGRLAVNEWNGNPEDHELEKRLVVLGRPYWIAKTVRPLDEGDCRDATSS